MISSEKIECGSLIWILPNRSLIMRLRCLTIWLVWLPMFDKVT